MMAKTFLCTVCYVIKGKKGGKGYEQSEEEPG